MVTNEQKEKFIYELINVPLISVVCKRLGFSKATYYRLIKRDKKFKKRVDTALNQGREGVNDLAEGQIITAIKEGDTRASKFWLENNDKRYVKPRPKNIFEEPYRGIRKITYEIIDSTTPEERKESESPPLS